MKKLVGQFTTLDAAREFIMSGAAVFTIVSKKTGTRYTYKVNAPKARKGHDDDGFRFVNVMYGSDNMSDYTNIGLVSQGNFRKNKSANPTDPRYVAFNWMFGKLFVHNTLPEDLEIWHEGRCGACAKRLTVPASIEKGFGPECAKSHYICA